MSRIGRSDVFSVRPIDRVALVGFVLLWLVPVAYLGFSKRSVPGMPPALSFLQNVSCLFPKRVRIWRIDYIQVLPQLGGDWVTLPEEEYFQMPAFGYRTRLPRFMALTMSKARWASRADLASWIHQRYQTLHPDEPAPIAVRFVVGHYRAEEHAPVGRWQKPPLEAFAPQETLVKSTHEFGPHPTP